MDQTPQEPMIGGDVSIARVIARLPASVATLLRKMMREPRHSREELRRLTAAHLVKLETAARDVDYLDVELAAAIANGCHRLVDTIAPPVTEDHRRLVQAAVLYFVLDEDVEGDTTSLIGLDDDRLVVDAVCDELGVQRDG
jgi:hypothetical protein